MDRDRHLQVVRSLTKTVVEVCCPGQAADFAADFALWALTAGVPSAAERTSALNPPAQTLDTTLVAGMFFQVLVDASQLPAGSRERVLFVRQRAKDYLVTRLAGQITLSQFYRLLNLIEEKVGPYFERLDGPWFAPAAAADGAAASSPAPPAKPCPISGKELRRALANLALPKKGRKLTPETLWQFLRDSGGGWFRLLDFEAHFRVHKKTAWGYLNLLTQERILEHNGEKANRVRYALAARFRLHPSQKPV